MVGLVFICFTFAEQEKKPGVVIRLHLAKMMCVGLELFKLGAVLLRVA